MKNEFYCRVGYRLCPKCKCSAETICVYGLDEIRIGTLGIFCKKCGLQKKADINKIDYICDPFDFPKKEKKIKVWRDEEYNKKIRENR